ncbi:hypothetical protein KIL84_011322 [Mauremys mutica]|uniref:Uncharacterized protein n=1 Tax=Mauremys mutica TaxID=74926 RepID=A0A9D3XEL9_9SAUR|nr:hypothetical protein KIL84_011322 [Mauremys mutica]
MCSGPPKLSSGGLLERELHSFSRPDREGPQPPHSSLITALLQRRELNLPLSARWTGLDCQTQENKSAGFVHGSPLARLMSKCVPPSIKICLSFFWQCNVWFPYTSSQSTFGEVCTLSSKNGHIVACHCTL